MPASANLCLIYGSARSGRLCDTVADWTQNELAWHDYFAVQIVDPLVHHDPGERNRILERADAFLVITPEYNHSFPAPLKEIIDGATSAWEAKPVAFVSYGGRSGGLRAVEHLRSVFASLHTVGVREQILITNPRSAFDGAGQPSDKGGLHHAFTAMMARLTWWADALLQARAKHPYREAA
jgi:NAD(P)H-dependent FMN reductase